MESEVENWIQTYDTEMGEKQVIMGFQLAQSSLDFAYNDLGLTFGLFPRIFESGYSSLALCSFWTA